MTRFSACVLLFTIGLSGCNLTFDENGIGIKPWRHTETPVVKPEVDVTPHVEPLKADGLRALFIEDVTKRKALSAVQKRILFGAEVRKFLDDHCEKNPDGTPKRMFVDKSTELTGCWKTLCFDNPPKSSPWMILQNGGSVLSKPLPSDWDEMKTDLDKFAGVK